MILTTRVLILVKTKFDAFRILRMVNRISHIGLNPDGTISVVIPTFKDNRAAYKTIKYVSDNFGLIIRVEGYIAFVSKFDSEGPYILIKAPKSRPAKSLWYRLNKYFQNQGINMTNAKFRELHNIKY